MLRVGMVPFLAGKQSFVSNSTRFSVGPFQKALAVVSKVSLRCMKEIKNNVI